MRSENLLCVQRGRGLAAHITDSLIASCKKLSTKRNIININIALSIPAMNIDREAGLRGCSGKGDRQLSIAATNRPGRRAILYAEIGVGTIDKGSQRVAMIGLNRDGLVTFSSSRTAGGQLHCTRAAV